MLPFQQTELLQIKAALAHKTTAASPQLFVSVCAIRDFHEGTSLPEDSAALALEKGCDLNCGCTYESIIQSYKQGKVTEEESRRSAERLFTTRFLLGLFDHSSLDEIPYNVVGCRKPPLSF